MSEIVVRKGTFGEFAEPHETDLVISKDCPHDVWLDGMCGKIADAQQVMWHIAAGVVHGVKYYHGKADPETGKVRDIYQEIHENTGFAISTLKQAKRVYERIPEPARIPGLSYWLHKEVAALPSADEAHEVLSKAHDEHWTQEQIKEEVKRRNGSESTLTENCNKEPTVINAEFSEVPNLTNDGLWLPSKEVKRFAEFLGSLYWDMTVEERQECKALLTMMGSRPPAKPAEPEILPISINTSKEDIKNKKISNTGAIPKKRTVAQDPPTLEVVTAYASEIELPPEEAEHFRDFYNSKNWKVGRDAMTDWKSALRNWKRTWKDRQNSKARANPQNLTMAQRAKLEAYGTL